MATVLTGSVDILRIWELLEKVLAPGDLANYSVAIDYKNDTSTLRIPLDKLKLLVQGEGIETLTGGHLMIVDDTDPLNVILSVDLPSITDDGTDVDIAANLIVTGQAHGGYYVKTFTASATFDANNGNNQIMTCTGDTTIALSNELPGVYIIDLPISGGGVSLITIGASLGTAYTSNDSLSYTDGSQNTITVFVNASGTKKYTITAIAA